MCRKYKLELRVALKNFPLLNTGEWLLSNPDVKRKKERAREGEKEKDRYKVKSGKEK